MERRFHSVGGHRKQWWHPPYSGRGGFLILYCIPKSVFKKMYIKTIKNNFHHLSHLFLALVKCFILDSVKLYILITILQLMYIVYIK